MTTQLAIPNKKTRFGPKVASRDWWIERIKISKPQVSYWTHFTKYQIGQFKALVELDYQVLGERFSTEGAPDSQLARNTEVERTTFLVDLGLQDFSRLQALDLASSNQGAGVAH